MQRYTTNLTIQNLFQKDQTPSKQLQTNLNLAEFSTSFTFTVPAHLSLEPLNKLMLAHVMKKKKISRAIWDGFCLTWWWVTVKRPYVFSRCPSRLDIHDSRVDVFFTDQSHTPAYTTWQSQLQRFDPTILLLLWAKRCGTRATTDIWRYNYCCVVSIKDKASLFTKTMKILYKNYVKSLRLICNLKENE